MKFHGISFARKERSHGVAGSVLRRSKGEEKTQNTKHNDVLPEAVYQKILPVYQRLSQRDLLERCLMGATQNANESFNGVIWRMCPKEVNAGHQVVEMAANLATVTFNDGATGLCEVLKEMGCHVGEHTKAGLALEDAERTHFADAASTPYQKERRKKRRRKTFIQNLSEIHQPCSELCLFLCREPQI